MPDHKTPGKYAVQLGTDAPGQLDFASHDADSLEDAMGYVREALVLHPDFVWDVIMIWKDRTVQDLYRSLQEMPDSQVTPLEPKEDL